MINIQELSYSFHIGNDKNKTKVARKTARNNSTNSTSFSNNAIQNMADLTKADKHNLRKYDNDKELIKTIKGTDSITSDVKELYKTLFEDAKNKYNEKQTRNDRKIDNYFNHIANDDKHDLACEIIIELGDMNYWNQVSNEDKQKMINVFKDQCFDLEVVVPNFKIANATIHFDESSPHLHIIGIAYKDGNKNGMYKQVGKATVFNKESLIKIQDEMRERCIESFNKTYNLNYSLKEKEKGRNKDIHVKEMENYYKFKDEKNKCNDTLDKLNKNANTLSDSSKLMLDLLNDLKTTTLNKNMYHLSNEQKLKLENFINEAYESSKNMLNTNHINSVLKEYEEYLDNHNKEILNKNKRIEKLEKDVNRITTDYYKIKNDYNKESYKNTELSDIIESSNHYIKGIMNFISKMCSEGYIPQEKYEEQGTLFRNDEGKWIKGKYYTKDELDKMKKNNGYEL
ncbi:MAG: plasmid recombination protein [Methanobacteriaceae archaeon]|nr:plasmid recombination protein [Methanobacteriaceae archaeon]